MSHKKYLHLPTIKKDILIIVIINICFFWLFGLFDVLEVIYDFSRKYEYWELDEFIPLGATLTLSLLIFSYRRIKELGKIADTLEKLSLLDPLTNLPNRRSCQLKLLNWCNAAQSKGKSFNVFQLDLDNFKQVNELYGDSIGDESIILVGQIIQHILPKGADVCRWLDDNFIIITPNTHEYSPDTFAENLQSKISGKIMPSTLTITCSIGYTTWKKGNHPEYLLEQIEDALMIAKSNGGNKVFAVD